MHLLPNKRIRWKINTKLWDLTYSVPSVKSKRLQK